MRLNWVCIRRAQKGGNRKKTYIGLRKRDEMIFESEKGVKKENDEKLVMLEQKEK